MKTIALILILVFTSGVFGQVVVSAPYVNTPPRHQFSVPIHVDEEVFTFQFHLVYDTRVAVAKTCSSEIFNVDCNFEVGRVRVSGYTAVPVAGTAITIGFQAKNKPGCSKLRFEELYVYYITGMIESVHENGRVCITPQ